MSEAERFDLDRKPVLMLPPGVRIPEEAAQGLFLHDVQEFANLAASLSYPHAAQAGGAGCPYYYG